LTGSNVCSSKLTATEDKTAVKIFLLDQRLNDISSIINKRRKYHEKDLVGIPWRVAFALQDDGWYLRRDIIWHKPNPMPSAATDRE
jgi:DNA modification methylase